MQKAGSRIFLCKPEQMEKISAQDGENALFLCAGQPSCSALDYCAFPADTDLTAMFNFVQRLFDRLDGDRGKAVRSGKLYRRQRLRVNGTRSAGHKRHKQEYKN